MDFSLIPIFVLFIITLACAVIGNTCNAYYIKFFIKNMSGFYILNAGLSLICALVLFCVGGFKFEISAYSLLLGLAFGTITMVYTIVNSVAIKIGPYGYTTVIVSLSTAITAISGSIFWNEPIGIFKITGIILMCACFYLAVDTKKEEGKHTNVKWFILCLIGLFLCASVGLIQKIHQNSIFKLELIPFLIVAFLTSGILSLLIFMLLKSRKRKTEITLKNQTDIAPKGRANNLRKIIILSAVMIICGICTAANNALNLYLSGVVDTAVFFPIVNGIPLMMSLVVSFFLFKERLNKKQMSGLVIGLISIVCLFI